MTFQWHIGNVPYLFDANAKYPFLQIRENEINVTTKSSVTIYTNGPLANLTPLDNVIGAYISPK